MTVDQIVPVQDLIDPQLILNIVGQVLARFKILIGPQLPAQQLAYPRIINRNFKIRHTIGYFPGQYAVDSLPWFHIAHCPAAPIAYE